MFPTDSDMGIYIGKKNIELIRQILSSTEVFSHSVTTRIWKEKNPLS